MSTPYGTSAAELGLAVLLASTILEETFAAASSAQGVSTGSMLFVVSALCAFAKSWRKSTTPHRLCAKQLQDKPVEETNAIGSKHSWRIAGGQEDQAVLRRLHVFSYAHIC
jgi:hypothetical protein